MKFKHGTRRRALEYEKEWAATWKENKTFEKSVEGRPKDDSYVFYDGPPFITGVPHHGTLLSSIVKDAVPRYWTMKGKRVERVWGWDCHGLPAENFVEKQLNITDRRQIVTNADAKAPLDKDGNELPTITLEQYITKARESMVANSATWEDVVDRVGRWVDFKGAYRTMDKNFMESVWWAFKTLYEKGKIYEGEKVLMYDTKFATPVSKNEVTMDNDAYQTVTDPSVYVKFKLQPAKKADSSLKIEKIDLNSNYTRFAEETRFWPDYAEKIKKRIAANKAVLFGAKIGDTYVGRVTLWLDDWRDEDPTSGANKIVTDYFPNLPAIQALEVREEYRRFGVASELLRVAEQEALERGFTEIGLGVEPDNLPAIKLYEKASYEKTPVDGLEKYHCWWQEKNDKGELQKFDIDCFLMKKQLVNVKDVTYLLAWTTTPWTLPGNTALAVNKDLDYVEVKAGDEQFILAKDLVEKVLQDEKHQPLAYEVLRTLKGEELVGKSYEPLFADHGKNAHKVWAADYVSSENGTGIVHLAPIYGEEDFVLAQENDIPRVHVLDDNGYYYPEVAAELYKLMPWIDSSKPIEVWENNKNIAKGLEKAGVVWKTEYIRHEYPFNPRSKQRIMYRAIPSWFFDVQGSKPLMLEQNENINWFPAHLKEGRFAKNIDQAPDWNLSRDRFWATAMPVWKGDKGTVKVVGSYAELKELSGVELEDYHRPWVDDITFEIDGEKFTRIEKVLDCWFESGSMPFAQFHYPFENKAKFEDNFPGDFIVEYVGQVRAWFYYVHTINTALFGNNAFKNVITTGVVAGNDGRKMSKSLGNFTDPNELMDKFSADSLRFLLLSSPLLKGEDFALHDKDVGDIARKLSMVWNMYDFFTMYAEVDGWEFDATKPFTLNPDDVTNPMDKWIISRVHQLNWQITEDMDAYNIPDAMADILPLLDDASNWYVRRSRRRFWKSDDDTDKNEAYRTLHYVLLKLSVLLAPFTPFLAEELYQNLGGGNESVHLLDWPTNYTVDQQVLDEMEQARTYVNEGLSLRAKAGLKVRQPLASVTVPTVGEVVDYKTILLDELNVKEVKMGEEIAIDETLTPELQREGLMREVIRHVQAARKKAGLNVDDRINLHLLTEDSELTAAISEHHDAIYAETLAVSSEVGATDAEMVKIDGIELAISLEKTLA